jgi:hypothetical protein
VCVGAICEEGNIVLIATDRMWTNPYLSIQYEYPEPKIEELSSCCAAAIAGSVVLPTEACERVKEKIEHDGINIISQIAYTFKEEYSVERRKRIDDDIFKPRGFTMRSFYQEGLQRALNDTLVRLLDSEVEDYTSFDLEVLVGGVDNKGHLYVIFPPGRVEPFERIGYVSIGSGMVHAQYTFILEGYTPQSSLERALYLIFKAKKISERAPGVGQSTDIKLITKNGSFDVPDYLMKELQTIFDSEISSAVVNKKEMFAKLGEVIKQFRQENKI